MVGFLHLDNKTDEELLLLLQQHHHAAFAALVRRHAQRFRQLAHRYTGTREDAEDIVQELFLKLWDKPTLWRTDSGAKFTTWFYRIVVNRCLDHQRRTRPLPIIEGQEFEDEAPGAEIVLLEHERQQRVEQAFRSLSADFQTALNLSFYEPVPNREAAEMMGLSVKAFQSLLMRAKQALKEKVMSGENRGAKRYVAH